VEQGQLPSDPVLRRLVEAAVRAPSGDNCQPWQFHFDGGDRLEISFLPERAKSFFDFNHCGTLISVGAVIENIRIQAASDGLAVDVTYTGDEDPGRPVVVLGLRPDEAITVASARLHAMLQRTVTRRPFLPKKIAREKLSEVLANPVEGVDVRVIEDGRSIRQWARLIYLADRIRYTHPVIHKELFEKIQFTKAAAQQTRIGLEIDRLGAGPAANLIMRFLQPWPRMQRLRKIGVDRALSGHSRLLAVSSGALVLLTIPGTDQRHWITAGEQVERLWVQAQEQGLCVHPMTVALYLVQRYREEGPAAFLPQHLPLLKEIEAGLDSFLGNQVGAMIFRLGYGWRMGSTAVRLPVEQLMRGE